jgi:hypothetical protein
MKQYKYLFAKEAGLASTTARTVSALAKAEGAATRGLTKGTPAFTKALQDPNVVRLQTRLKGMNARQSARVAAKPMIPVNAQTAQQHLSANPILRNKGPMSEEAAAYRQRAQQELPDKLYYQGRGQAEQQLSPLQQRLKAHTDARTQGAAPKPVAPPTPAPAPKAPGFFDQHKQNIQALWNSGREGGWGGFKTEFMKNPARNAGYAAGGAYGLGTAKDTFDAMTGSDEYDYGLWDKIKMGIGMEQKPSALDPFLPFFARGYHAN